MNWFNLYGLIFMAVIMIPNIVFAMKCKDGFENLWQNKTVETLEQIGRFSSFILMVINIPRTVFGFWCSNGFSLYIIINSVLIALYCITWIILFKKNSVLRAVLLSVIPSAVFIFSGIIELSIPLIIASVIFAPCHITLSVKNAKLANK